MSNRILLDHGSGGAASHRLIGELFATHFDNPILARFDDAALLETKAGKLAMSTDGYTVTPLFFPGGDIGSLAVNGTVNDVAMLGAKPLYLTCACIIEEGFAFDDLERIVISMGRAAKEAGVLIVGGDTKVVPKGAADKIFITTTGIGQVVARRPVSGHNAKPGDAVLISGSLGDHGLTIMASREALSFEADLQSDCAALNGLILELLSACGSGIHVLRDPTRGGLATTLNEIASQSAVSIEIEQKDLPVKQAVAAGCSFLGLDPLYLANEGKLIVVVDRKKAKKAMDVLRAHPLGIEAAVIGQVGQEKAGQVSLKTPLGGRRLLGMLEGEQLPRIC